MAIVVSRHQPYVADVSSVEILLLSQEKTPAVIRKFFEDDLSEVYLWHVHSLMSEFHSNIAEIERENNSLLEVINCLKSVQSVLQCRAQDTFMSLKVKELLMKLRRDGLDDRCDAFCSQVATMYSTCLEYIEMWTQPLEEFTSFAWMTLTEIPSWNAVKVTVNYLTENGVHVDDSKCFDQLCNLKKFVEANSMDNDFSKFYGR